MDVAEEVAAWTDFEGLVEEVEAARVVVVVADAVGGFMRDEDVGVSWDGFNHFFVVAGFLVADEERDAPEFEAVHFDAAAVEVMTIGLQTVEF